MGNKEQFVLGFIAGEGSFNVSVYRQDDMKFGVTGNEMFSLGVHEDDSEALEVVKETLGVGEIYSDTQGKKQFMVSKRSELLELVDWMDENVSDEFKRTEKYQSYLRWKELVVNRKDYISSEDKMVEYVKKAREVNGCTKGRGTNGKTSEELESIIRDNAS